MLAFSLFDEVHPFLARDADHPGRVPGRTDADGRRFIRSGAVRALLRLAGLFAVAAALGTACHGSLGGAGLGAAAFQGALSR